MSKLTIENEKISYINCGNKALIMKGNESKLCVNCKKENFIEIINKNTDGTNTNG